ncbi:MAG: hypothetical protein MjAS7_1883 [Metallosphaera javensis (ex Sakai et al. 2022)]|nr:MAG: hypothetical protein MjAS7_1883 [Metallosphaera javensis (ex Sakai et al. 2022)]
MKQILVDQREMDLNKTTLEVWANRISEAHMLFSPVQIRSETEAVAYL